MPFHPVDVHVGARLRQRRLLGMSQTALGDAVDPTGTDTGAEGQHMTQQPILPNRQQGAGCEENVRR